MNDLVEYIHKTLGMSIVISDAPTDRLHALPLYITKSYRFYITQIGGVDCILAEVQKDADFSPKQYVIHERLLQARTERVVVFVFHSLESYVRARLAAHGLNFILIGAQIHLPALWLTVSKHALSKREPVKTITPTAQAVLLYYLYSNGNDYELRFLAEQLNMPYPTVCRAVETLAGLGLCNASGSRTKSVHFNEDKQTLLQQALPLLKSPIKRVVYADLLHQDALLSGWTALSEYTMLNPTEQTSVAISMDEYKSLAAETMDDMYMPCRIEVWNYNPRLFARNGLVDKISLYLCLCDTLDERAQHELKEMLNSLW